MGGKTSENVAKSKVGATSDRVSAGLKVSKTGRGQDSSKKERGRKAESDANGDKKLLSDIYARMAVEMDKKSRSELAEVIPETNSGILENPEYRIDSLGSTEVVGVIQHNNSALLSFEDLSG